MVSRATLSAIRFGTGLPSAAEPDGLVAELSAPDTAAARFPVAPMETKLEQGVAFIAARKAERQNRTEATTEARKVAIRLVRKQARDDRLNTLARAAYSPHGFRERLTLFWADHFTTRHRSVPFQGTVSNFIDTAIRPNIGGRFADMLRAVVTNPVMLIYLDQAVSVGPNSPAAERRRRRGLNENLARELIELHTMGAGSGYTQDDVRQLAELLTGLTVDTDRLFRFNPAMAEPGAETVLGRAYGGGEPSLDDIYAVLDDLARRPETARHLAQKLAVHFVSSTPDPAMVAAMAEAYRASDGALDAVYNAMLAHPSAWQGYGDKVKWPVEFLVSAVRALDPEPEKLLDMSGRTEQTFVLGPLAAMGQRFHTAPAPDGWSEDAEAWVTPQGLAARIQWAMAVPRALSPRLPDPREFVHRALGDAASERLIWAAGAAETKWEGIGIILSSAEFNRR